MACINPDGSLSGPARKILGAMQAPTTLEAVAEATGLPLYRIRSSIRELVQAGFVKETEGRYSATSAGRARIEG